MGEADGSSVGITSDAGAGLTWVRVRRLFIRPRDEYKTRMINAAKTTTPISNLFID